MIYALQSSPAAELPASGFSGLFSGTPWIDLVGLGLVVLFFALGIRRGLVWQVTRLIGVLVAVALARSLSPELAPKVETALNLPTTACQGIVWFFVFMGTLITTSMIGVIGKRALEAVYLGPMDRLGGGLAGAVTGVVLHSALLVLVTSVAKEDWTIRTLKGSASASMLDSLSRKTHVLLDAQAAERIMEPWGRTYDEQIFREQQLRVEAERRRSLDKAEQLRREADEIRRGAVAPRGPGSDLRLERPRQRPSAEEAKRRLRESDRGFRIR